MNTRRSFLRSVGAVALTAATASAVKAEQAAYEEKPEYVSLTYDQSTLEMYRPYLVTRHLDVTPSAVYGWIAESTERDTAIACYWVYYVTQQGATTYDSHQYDREPVYVEYDPDTGDVQAVHVDGYHYLVKTYPTPELDGNHPTLHVVKPHHFYRETTETGEELTVDDMHDKYGPWIDNDWQVDRASVVNPWTVTSRGHWWSDNAAGFSTRAAYWDGILDAAQLAGLNIGGAQEADL